MKTQIAAFVLAVLTVQFLPGPVGGQDLKIDPDRYGALAYSPKTGKYGYAWNQPAQGNAERIALAECKADDAMVLTWVKFGWAVLVIAQDNAYGYDEVHGAGVTSNVVYENALKKLRKQSDAEVKTVIIICSGDVKPQVINK